MPSGGGPQQGPVEGSTHGVLDDRSHQPGGHGEDHHHRREGRGQCEPERGAPQCARAAIVVGIQHQCQHRGRQVRKHDDEDHGPEPSLLDGPDRHRDERVGGRGPHPGDHRRDVALGEAERPQPGQRDRQQQQPLDHPVDVAAEDRAPRAASGNRYGAAGAFDPTPEVVPRLQIGVRQPEGGERTPAGGHLRPGTRPRARERPTRAATRQAAERRKTGLRATRCTQAKAPPSSISSSASSHPPGRFMGRNSNTAAMSRRHRHRRRCRPRDEGATTTAGRAHAARRRRRGRAVSVSCGRRTMRNGRPSVRTMAASSSSASPGARSRTSPTA